MKPMYSYKFSATHELLSTNVSTVIPANFVSFGNGDPVDWTKFTYDGNGLSAIPVEVVVEPTPLTASQVKQQSMTSLKYEYDPQIANVKDKIINAVIITKSATSEASCRSLLSQIQLEYIEKLGVIKNA